ncbi:hypothetical protein GMD93_10625 [Pseudoflavonifractor sp. BIOML-A4]|nr:hypothetical protein [Pseudoflavonifractor sp. BIOML-A4]
MTQRLLGRDGAGVRLDTVDVGVGKDGGRPPPLSGLAVRRTEIERG